MNIAKNMEAIFIVAALIGGSSLAFAAPSHFHAVPSVAAAAEKTAVPMSVVSVHAKRLSAADKAALSI